MGRGCRGQWKAEGRCLRGTEGERWVLGLGERWGLVSQGDRVDGGYRAGGGLGSVSQGDREWLGDSGAGGGVGSVSQGDRDSV